MLSMALGSTESLRVFPPCEMQGYSRFRKLQSFLKMDFFFFKGGLSLRSSVWP